MEVSGTGLSTAGTTSEVATKKLAENFDTFLTLLTTQLKNQDPLEPTDSNEFVRQLVQYSEVEQSISTNKNLEQLLDLQTTSQSVAAMGYMGNTIEALGNTAPLQNGSAQFSYAFDEEPKTAVIGIYNADGDLVTTSVAETSLGKHVFNWDGKDSNGNTLPDGNYTIDVVAKNADGEELEVATAVFGQVTGVESGAEGALLAIGSINVPLSQVISVKQTPPAS